MVEQQGEGSGDVRTHLVDGGQWECLPKVIVDTKDVKIKAARRWSRNVSKAKFKAATGLDDYPSYLAKDVQHDTLKVYANGEINYQLKGVHDKVIVIWNYQAPKGGDDTHYSIMRGTKANLVIRQGEAQRFMPSLYIEPTSDVTDLVAFENALQTNLPTVQKKYPGISLRKDEAQKQWEVVIPQKYHVGHEAHFGQVTEAFLGYLIDGKLPEWEVPNMITKYYTTTKAWEMAKAAGNN